MRRIRSFRTSVFDMILLHKCRIIFFRFESTADAITLNHKASIRAMRLIQHVILFFCFKTKSKSKTYGVNDRVPIQSVCIDHYCRRIKWHMHTKINFQHQNKERIIFCSKNDEEEKVTKKNVSRDSVYWISSVALAYF